jgi:hypothetical protein
MKSPVSLMASSQIEDHAAHPLGFELGEQLRDVGRRSARAAVA